MAANERADEDRLESLIARYLASEHSERSLDRADLLEEHPEFADSLREFFANHDRMKAVFDVDELTLAADGGGPDDAKGAAGANRHQQREAWKAAGADARNPDSSDRDSSDRDSSDRDSINGDPMEWDNLKERHPELAAELQSLLALHDQLCRRAPADAKADEAASDGPCAPPHRSSTLGGNRADTQPMIDWPFLTIPDGRLGPYRLLEPIGRGGMGLVVKARHLGLARTVALKMLPGQHFSNAADLQRFQAEPRAAARMEHPGIVPVYDVGVLKGIHYYSMPFVEGQSLAERLEAGPIEPREAAHLMIQVAEAVHYAHQRGVLHRDLKPANILIDTDGSPKITDFGLAKSAVADDLTATGEIVGTPAYMSPEQADASPSQLGAASDIYSLGATLYAMLTGRPPFQSAHVLDTLTQVRQRQPVGPRELNPLVPRDLQTICLKCLEKSPDRRYATAQELADDLQRHLNGEPILARDVGALERGWRWVQRHPAISTWAAATASILGLALAVLIALTFWLHIAHEDAHRQAELAKQAERQRSQQLQESYLNQIRALRWSGRDGQRYRGLDVVRAASELGPSLELRNEAIACLSLPDLRFGEALAKTPATETFVIHDIAVAPSWQRYVLGDATGNLSVRQMSDGTETVRCPGPGTAAGYMTISPDGRYLAVDYTSSRHFVVWDLDSGQPIIDLNLELRRRAIDFSADSQQLAVAFTDDRIWVFRLADGETSRILAQPIRPYALAFDPRGERLAITSSENRLFVIDADSGDVQREIQLTTGVNDAAWHPDRNLIAAAGADHHIHLIDVDQGSVVGKLRGHLSNVTEVAFSRGAGRHLASLGWDNTLRLWDFESEREIVQLPDVRIRGQFCLHFSPDNRKVAYDFREDTGLLRAVEVNTAEECLRLQTRLGHEPRVDDVAFNDDGSILAAGAGDLYFWDTHAARQVAFRPSIYAGWVSWLPDGLLTSSRNAHARSLFYWPTADHNPSNWLRMQPRALIPDTDVRQHAVSQHGKQIAATAVRQVVVTTWNGYDQVGVLPEDALARLPMPNQTTRRDVYTVAISPDGRWIAAGVYQGRAVLVWDRHSLELVQQLDAGFGNAIFVGFSPDGQTLVVGDEDQYQFFSVGNWKLQQRFQRNGGSALVAIRQDGAVLAASDSASSIVLLNANSLQELARFELPEGGLLTDIAFSPNGAQLAAATENQTTYLWNMNLIQQAISEFGLDWGTPPAEPHASASLSRSSLKPDRHSSPAHADDAPNELGHSELGHSELGHSELDHSDGASSDSTTAGEAAPFSPTGRLTYARKLCAEERWNDAIRAIQEVAVFTVEHRGSPEFKIARFRPAAIFAISEQWPAYHASCRGLLETFRNEQDVSLLEQTAKACLFAEPEPTNRDAACALAERAYQLDANAWTRIAMAFAALRRDQLDAAEQYCHEVLAANPPHWYQHAQPQLILALIAAKRQRQDDAEHWKQAAHQQLARMEVAMTEQLHEPTYQDWLVCQHLLRELDNSLANLDGGRAD